MRLTLTLTVGIVVAVAFPSPTKVQLARATVGDTLILKNLLTNAWDRPIAEAVTRLVRKTPFETRWQINRRPVPDKLNIYVLKSHLGARAGDLPAGAEAALGNCAAAGKPNLIICDAEFLETFLDNVGVSAVVNRMPDAAARRERYQNALILWVLGHEMGHILFRDAPSHFKPGGLSIDASTFTLDQRREFRADSFFVARVSNTGQALDVTQLVMDLLNAEIRRKVGDVPTGVGILYDYTNRRVVEFARRGTHPEFVIRGARLLELIGRFDRNLGALGAMVAPFVRHMREARQ